MVTWQMLGDGGVRFRSMVRGRARDLQKGLRDEVLVIVGLLFLWASIGNAQVYVSENARAADVWIILTTNAQAADCWLLRSDLTSNHRIADLWVYITDSPGAADKWVILNDNAGAADPVACLLSE